MIILGIGQPNESLINKEPGTLYFDKLTSKIYFKESQNSWKFLETLWNFDEFKNSITDYLSELLSKVQYNFSIEGNNLRIQSNDGTYDKFLVLPKVIESSPRLHIPQNSANIKGNDVNEIVNAIISNLHSHPEVPKDYKYILHVQNPTEFKLEANKAFDLIQFPTIIYTNYTPQTPEETFQNFLTIPKDGYYYLEARCKVSKQEQTKISMQIVKDNEKLAKTCNNPNSLSNFHLSTHCHKVLKKGDILTIRLIASKGATVKEVELFIEAKY